MNRIRNFVKKKMNLQRYAASDMIDRTGAEALISEEVANEIIQGVAEQSTVLRMGRKLPNMSKKKYRMPVLDMLPVAYWVAGDSGFKQTSKMAWKNKYITAEELAVIIPIPEAVVDDADYDIWGEVRPRAVEALGKKIDGAVIFGVEKGMSGGGVVLPGGHVIGVVSANLNSQGRIMVYNEKDEAVGYMPYSSDYFLFTPISRQNATFIRGTIASFHEPGRSANLANISPREAERSDVTLQTAFGGALTVRDITGANQQ